MSLHYIAPKWEQLSEAEKNHFFSEEKKLQKLLLLLPVYSRVQHLFRLVKKIKSTCKKHQSDCDFLIPFQSALHQLQEMIRRYTLPDHPFFMIRNTDLLQSYADSLYSLSMAARSISDINPSYLFQICEEIDALKKDLLAYREKN